MKNFILLLLGLLLFAVAKPQYVDKASVITSINANVKRAPATPLRGDTLNAILNGIMNFGGAPQVAQNLTGPIISIGTATAITPLSVTNSMLAGAIAFNNMIGSDITLTENQVTNLTTDLASKQEILISNVNIKTVGGISLIGSGDIPIGTSQLAVKNTVLSLNDSANVIWDYSKSSIANVTITDNRNIVLKNVCEGCVGTLYVQQSAAGGYSLSNLNLKLSKGPNDVDQLKFTNKGGVLRWTVDNYGAVFYDTAFTVAVAAAPVVPSSDIVFTTTNNITVIGKKWTPTVNIGNQNWGQTGIATTTLAANADGEFRMAAPNDSAQFGMIGFKLLNSIGGYQSFDISVWLAGPNYGRSLQVIDGGIVRGAGANYGLGYLIRIFRKGSTGVFTLETSANGGTTWAVVYTYSFTSTTKLSYVSDIRGDGALFTPQYFFY